MLGWTAAPDLAGTGSVAVVYVELKSVGDVGDVGEDDRDWNSGEDVEIGRLKGTDIDILR